MNLGSPARLPFQCFYKACPSRQLGQAIARLSPNSRPLVRKGSFLRTSDSKRISRFQCRICLKTFSQASFSECFRQKKRRLNQPLGRLFYSGVSQRRAARLLGTTRRTIERKFVFLGLRALSSQAQYVRELASGSKFSDLQFDEMESFERSKCLPLSIPIVVESGSRKILGFRVCQMPAKGPLAEISRRKYGPRADQRAQAASELFTQLRPFIQATATFSSDENPRYPSWIRSHFPKAEHLKFKGRRGRAVGQGELKSGGFDPLFSFNHTAAMIRANINRLFRRTWCTTKRRDGLALHLAIYADYHNRVLTRA